jgi:hypothetical protein
MTKKIQSILLVIAMIIFSSPVLIAQPTEVQTYPYRELAHEIMSTMMKHREKVNVEAERA